MSRVQMTRVIVSNILFYLESHRYLKTDSSYGELLRDQSSR